MKTKSTFITTIAIALTYSCTAPLISNNDRGWYRYGSIDDPEKIIDVTVNILPIPDPPVKEDEKAKTFFDLRDSIPNTFLRVIGNKAQNYNDIISAVKEPLSNVKEDEKPTKTSVKMQEIKVRFIFSNIKKYYNNKLLLHPNTRLEFLNTTIKLESDELKIIAIDRIENEYEKIDLGNIERTQNVEFKSKLSAEGNIGETAELNTNFLNQDASGSTYSDERNVYDAKGNIIGKTSQLNNSNSTNNKSNSLKTNISNNIAGKGDLDYSNSEAIKEALQLKYKKIKTGFSYNPSSITISQRGAPLSDISDNIVVTAILQVVNNEHFCVSRFSNLFDENGNVIAVENIKQEKYDILFPNCKDSFDIKFTVKYEGLIRSVKNQRRGRNILEYDDKVIYYKFSGENTNQDNLIIDKYKFCHEVYKMQAKFANDTNTYTLCIDDPLSSEILFFDDDKPEQFYNWLLGLIKVNNYSNFVSKNIIAFRESVKDNVKYVSSPNFSKSDLDALKEMEELSFIDR
jgi:hypothetical protein